MPFLGQNGAGQFTGDPSAAVEEEHVFGTPVDDLCREETIKYENNGLDSWSSLTKHAAAGTFPPADDVFRFKFHGLFYVSPAQDSYIPATDQPIRIDYIFASRPLAPLVRHCEIVQEAAGTEASDHRPVLADIEEEDW